MIPYWKILFLIVSSFFPDHPVSIEKLNPQINSRFDEINPVVSPDGKTLYFTRVGHPGFDKTLIKDGVDIACYLDFDSYFQALSDIYTEIGEKPGIHPFQSSFNQDIWIAESFNSPFDKVYHPKYPLNNALPNSVCAAMNDSNTLAVLNQFYRDGSMYKGFSFTTWKDGKWQFPQPLHIYDYYNLDPDANLSLSQNGEILLMSINRKDSRGDHDIYVSFRIHETLWSTPQTLGKTINTLHREVTPFISNDGRFLLFSSNRPGTIGGNDIYMSFRLDDTWLNWTEPIQMPASINSNADDGQPFLHESSGYLYFISNRDGSSDIFRSHLDYQRYLRLNSESLTYFVIHSKNPEPVSTSWLNRSNGNKSTRDNQKIEKNEMDSLKPIYFRRSKVEILPASYPALDDLVNMMNTHSSIHIQIKGHTDNIGNKHDLFNLSEKRASAVRQYLIREGIQSFRITFKGCGDEIPITDNSTEEKRALNRRVEVVITKA